MAKILYHLSIFFIMIFFSNFNYGLFNPYEKWLQHNKEHGQRYAGEKPSFCKQGFYKDGKFIQFTVDEKAFFCGVGVGAMARIILAFSNCYTKFETFKASVVRPGIAKSALFWLPTIFVYNSVMATKEKEGLLEKLARIQAEEEDCDNKDGQSKE